MYCHWSLPVKRPNGWLEPLRVTGQSQRSESHWFGAGFSFQMILWQVVFFFHGTCDMWHVTEKSGCELIALWDRICSANVRFTRKRSEWAAEMAIFPIQHYCTSWIIFVYTPFSDLPWLAEICYGILSVFKDLICLSDASTPYIHVHPLKLFQ